MLSLSFTGSPIRSLTRNRQIAAVGVLATAAELASIFCKHEKGAEKAGKGLVPGSRSAAKYFLVEFILAVENEGIKSGGHCT